MPRNQPEAGNRSPFRLRVGVEVDTWRGVNKESDPGAIADSQFQSAINVRILPNGSVICRGGQSKLFGNALGGCVTGIFDDERPAVPTQWWFGGGYNGGPNPNNIIGIDTTVNAMSLFVDPTYPYGGFWWAATFYNGAIHVMITDNNTQIALVKWDPVNQQTVLLHDFSGAGLGANPNPTGLTVANGLLYIGIMDGSTHCKVYTWDGASVVFDSDLGAMTAPPIMATYNNEPYIAICAALTAHADAPIYRRTGGVWSSLGAPSISAFDMAVFNGKLYICGKIGVVGGNYAGKILSWDGASLAVVRTLTFASNRATVFTLGVMGGFLCYVYADDKYPSLGGSGAFLVGTYDGTTWTDSAKDLTAQFGVSVTTDPYALIAFVSSNTLYVMAVLPNLPSANPYLLQSPLGAVAGTWVNAGAFPAYPTDVGGISGNGRVWG